MARAELPLVAECDKCGRPFLGGRVHPDGSVGLGIGELYGGRGFSLRGADGEGATIGNTFTGPEWKNFEVSCPREGCDGWGRIPDGVVDTFAGVVTLFRSTNRRQLAALATRVTSYVEGGASKEDVLEAAPRASRPFIADLIEKHKDNWVFVLIVLILAAFGAQDAIVKDVEAGAKFVKEAAEAAAGLVAPPTPRSSPPPTTLKPPAVPPHANDPCWCGSGRRYKRCHRVGS